MPSRVPCVGTFPLFGYSSLVCSCVLGVKTRGVYIDISLLIPLAQTITLDRIFLEQIWKDVAITDISTA